MSMPYLGSSPLASPELASSPITPETAAPASPHPSAGSTPHPVAARSAHQGRKHTRQGPTDLWASPAYPSPHPSNANFHSPESPLHTHSSRPDVRASDDKFSAIIEGLRLRGSDVQILREPAGEGSKQRLEGAKGMTTSAAPSGERRLYSAPSPTPQKRSNIRKARDSYLDSVVGGYYGGGSQALGGYRNQQREAIPAMEIYLETSANAVSRRRSSSATRFPFRQASQERAKLQKQAEARLSIGRDFELEKESPATRSKDLVSLLQKRKEEEKHKFKLTPAEKHGRKQSIGLVLSSDILDSEFDGGGRGGDGEPSPPRSRAVSPLTPEQLNRGVSDIKRQLAEDVAAYVSAPDSLHFKREYRCQPHVAAAVFKAEGRLSRQMTIFHRFYTVAEFERDFYDYLRPDSSFGNKFSMAYNHAKITMDYDGRKGDGYGPLVLRVEYSCGRPGFARDERSTIERLEKMGI